MPTSKRSINTYCWRMNQKLLLSFFSFRTATGTCAILIVNSSCSISAIFTLSQYTTQLALWLTKTLNSLPSSRTQLLKWPHYQRINLGRPYKFCSFWQCVFLLAFIGASGMVCSPDNSWILNMLSFKTRLRTVVLSAKYIYSACRPDCFLFSAPADSCSGRHSNSQLNNFLDLW